MPRLIFQRPARRSGLLR
ncbi:hypothetical protein HYALB_00003245 [Hymenoscyphus albidus]|uniref:Uncharacterized protein n=1 Tax=Hymenoscyphus albidus TaxID=595503 RepID=A0A9N9Q175_9HELO|nr:hypothetical protein HYALB_00003245 [Hymenoscyphus albidus]